MAQLPSVSIPSAQLAVLLAAGRIVQSAQLAADTAACLDDALRTASAALERASLERQP